MTGNLEMLFAMRNKEIAKAHKDANLQTADDVQAMAELGYFDTEFTMYGCAYLENGKRYYKVSPEAADIYRFIEQSNLRNIFPSNVVQYTKKCAVPAGMKEVIAQDVKVELAKQLSGLFPMAFFDTLHFLADQITEDTASAMLWQRVEELEGLFDIESLRRFEELLNYMYSCRKLTPHTFEKLHRWLKDERKSMMENFETKDIFEKTMYGAMYVDGERLRYVENARLEYVYDKIYDIEGKGGVVTPVFAKTYWYNYRYRLADVIRDYKQALHDVFTADYLERMEKIRRTDRFEDQFVDTVLKVREQFGIEPAETLLRYGDRWGIYRRDVLKFTL